MAGHIVTGGTGALGREVVRALLAGGASVAVPYREEEGWRALREEMAAGARLSGAPVDLADVAATARFVEEAAARLGNLTGVAAIAGAYAGSGPLPDAPADEWTRMMHANLDSAYSICRAALPHLRQSHGAIVTVGSKVVEGGGAGAAAYAVSKAGVVALPRVLALPNKGTASASTACCPASSHARESYRHAQGRSLGLDPPAAMRRVIVFLLSPESAPVSGGIVPVDAHA